MRTVAAGAAAASLGSAVSRVAASADERPDVLFIAIEDVSPHRLGCYGNAVCKTPHIDRFSETAVRFGNAHTSPPCCPSRTSLLLGLRPETSGVFGNGYDWHKLCPEALAMPTHFRNSGYETIRCGKMHHFEDGPSWSRAIRPHEGIPAPRLKGIRRKRRRLQGPGVEYARELREARKTGRGGSPFSYGPSGLDDREERDGMVAEQGIKLINEGSDKPRLIALGFNAPHLPFVAPDKYFELYPAEKMIIPGNPEADEIGMPKNRELLSQFNPHTPEQWRAAIAAHYACTSFMDAQVGRVLDALQKSGRADNTIVVIWSDHGFMLGENFRWRKGGLREGSTRVALLIRAPGVTSSGAVCERPAESIDIFPTMFDLCGISQPPSIEATSMKPLLQDPSREWKKGALMWSGCESHGVVTDRWRYNEYIGRPDLAELFDHDDDPGEFTNLARSDSHSAKLAELKVLLDGGWRSCLPG